MARTIAESLGKIKSDLASLLTAEEIHAVCRENDHRWRSGPLDPASTVHLFLRQVLEGNAACAHVVHWGEHAFSASAYCQARRRLPAGVLTDLAAQVARRLLGDRSGTNWRGRRTLLVDGSSFSMPDESSLQRAFGQPGAQAKGCGFPTAKLLALFDASTGAILEALPLKLRTHEQSAVADLHGLLQPGDVLVGDRGFCSYAHVALVAANGADVVFRLHQRVKTKRAAKRKGKRRSWSMQSPLQVLGAGDELVRWRRPKQRPTWIAEEDYKRLPEQLTMRIVRYRVPTRGSRTREVRLATTLLDPEQFPAADLAELYRGRWQVELYFRHLKQTMGMDVLRCKTVDGVQKEMTAYLLAYNLVRLVMIEAANRLDVPVDRVSFVDALRWIVERGAQEELVRLVVLPRRPGRVEPRVRKRRPKQYPLMKSPRAALRKRLSRKTLAA